jgi:hypothetical protein
MKTIELTRGKETTVDDAVYEALIQHGWKWYCSHGYAATSVTFHNGEKWTGTTFYLHRWIWDSWANRSLGGLQIDHINGDKLDNRLENLRVATNSQNQCNNRVRKDSSSKFKGVYYSKSKHKYRAHIYANGKSIHLGFYTDPLEAAKAYDQAAIHYFGEFARTNIRPLSELADYLRSLVESRGEF